MLERTPLLVSMAVFAGWGCTDDAQPGPPTTQLYHHDVLGISFELPADWETSARPTPTGSAVVFSGARASSDYYRTITLQSVARGVGTLGEAVEHMHASIAHLPKFAWHHREPTLVAGRPGFRYGCQVELHESLRLRHGVLFEASGGLVSLAYAATPELFGDGISVFEQALITLSVQDTRAPQQP